MRIAGAQPLNTSVVKLATKVFRKLVDLVTQLVREIAVSTSSCMLHASDQPLEPVVHPRFISLSAFNNLNW